MRAGLDEGLFVTSRGVDPLAIFGELHSLRNVELKIREYAIKLAEQELKQYSAELETCVPKLWDFAEFLVSAYDDALGQQHKLRQNSASCPRCPNGELRIRAQQPLPGHDGLEVHTYMCSVYGHSGAYLYRMPD